MNLSNRDKELKEIYDWLVSSQKEAGSIGHLSPDVYGQSKHNEFFDEDEEVRRVTEQTRLLSLDAEEFQEEFKKIVNSANTNLTVVEGFQITNNEALRKAIGSSMTKEEFNNLVVGTDQLIVEADSPLMDPKNHQDRQKMVDILISLRENDAKLEEIFRKLQEITE